MSLIKLFLAGNTSALVMFFLNQEGKIRNPKISEVFTTRKSLISDFTGFLAGDEDLTLTFLTVWRGTRVVNCKAHSI
jgi:hypothetical protein